MSNDLEKTTEADCLAVLEAGRPSSRCQQGWFLLSASREALLHASAQAQWCAGRLLVSSAQGGTNLVSLPLAISPCVCLCYPYSLPQTISLEHLILALTAVKTLFPKTAHLKGFRVKTQVSGLPQVSAYPPTRSRV